jgi:hypothetical protein
VSAVLSHDEFIGWGECVRDPWYPWNQRVASLADAKINPDSLALYGVSTFRSLRTTQLFAAWVLVLVVVVFGR